MHDIDGKSNAYVYLGTQDRHLIRLFHWVEILKDLMDEVRASDQDNELHEELHKISNRLIHEIGARMVEILP